MKQKAFRMIALIAVMVMVFAMVIPAGANQGVGNKHKVEQSFEDGVYIVQMIEEPVLGYEGDIDGFKATKPEQGKKVNPNDNRVVKYTNYLISKHENAVNRAGGGEKFYDYTYAFNGFAAQLTGAQAAKLASFPDVLSVTKDELMHIDTASTPDFLGLTDPGSGLWDQLGGHESAGEDVIVGIVDSGLWPENPSFSDQLDLSDASGSSGKRNLAYGPAPAGWNGDCQSGENWSQDDCNNKVIGARYFLDGYGHQGIIQTIAIAT